MFGDAYAGRRVLVTGHTGFKGAWLSEWLLGLGAEITGIALEPDTSPSLFRLLDLERRIARHHVLDVRDHAALAAAVTAARPEVIFHLAAQPLVRLSYRDPRATWDINVGGTVHLLEAMRATPGIRAGVIVTSDKCYENREQLLGYRESDPMGGHDPYSSSKGAVELAVASWRRSFFHDPMGCRLATARAGNVIGGGDWSMDRIVVDFVGAIAAGQPLRLRNPSATRPWQHVLEPLSGYLALAARLIAEDGFRFADGWNFGPATSNAASVECLARGLVSAWGMGSVEIVGNAGQPHEAGLLRLDVSKADSVLGWRGVWNLERTIHETVAWYREPQLAAASTARQIAAYVADARAERLPWAMS